MNSSTGDFGTERSRRRRRRRRGGSTVAWTTGLWIALTVGVIALSIVASALGKEQFGLDDLQWMADAGGSIKDSLLGFYGILGTIVIAMTADRSLGYSRSRPDSMDQYRRRTFLGLMAVLISVSATFSTALVSWYFLTSNRVDVALLFLVIPANVIIVALSITVADSVRPTLNREIRLLEADQKSVRRALQRVSRVASQHPRRVSVVTLTVVAILSILPAIGSPKEIALVSVAGTIAVAILWFPVVLLITRSRTSAETAAGHAAATVALFLLAVLFGWISASVYLQGYGPLRATITSLILVGIPTASGFFAPPAEGKWRALHGRTLAAATARWTESALLPREQELEEILEELRSEKASRLDAGMPTSRQE